MKRTGWISLFAGILFPVLSPGDWGLPNPPSTAVGDSGTFYLAESGLFFDIHNNDWFGRTDKLITFSSAIAFFRPLQTKASAAEATPEAFKLALNSRLLTPILKTRIDQEELSSPVGIFAEWLELQLAYSRMLGRFKIEGSFAGDFFGNYHTDDAYHYLHRAVGSEDKWDRFGPRYEGTFAAGSVGFGYAWSNEFLTMIFYNKSQIMEDQTMAANFVYDLGADLFLAVETRFVNQISSEVYEHLRPYRIEWGWGIRWRFLQMHFKFISPYLEEDRYGQYYVSPLILNWRF